MEIVFENWDNIVQTHKVHITMTQRMDQILFQRIHLKRCMNHASFQFIATRCLSFLVVDTLNTPEMLVNHDGLLMMKEWAKRLLRRYLVETFFQHALGIPTSSMLLAEKILMYGCWVQVDLS
ncbi:uncharacterized protein LOC17900366 [Capsella rubella]|uniref:uncharacterized protein LOC17900366 n=1 Tax=Capsella rubella TaxID=81985 RepID=UPI000CD52988|nr:uncharacterized protein LOC17900366 [Capsella rubella]